jgi:DNA-binding helix-hairpin-helix protein with protein kinase domain
MRYVRNRLSLAVIANPATCPPKIDFSCRLRMAANLAWMASEVHAAGHMLGDLHLRNVLGDLAGCLSVIDTDSFQFASQGRVYRSERGQNLGGVLGDFCASWLRNSKNVPSKSLIA